MKCWDDARKGRDEFEQDTSNCYSIRSSRAQILNEICDSEMRKAVHANALSIHAKNAAKNSDGRGLFRRFCRRSQLQVRRSRRQDSDRCRISLTVDISETDSSVEGRLSSKRVAVVRHFDEHFGLGVLVHIVVIVDRHRSVVIERRV